MATNQQPPPKKGAPAKGGANFLTNKVGPLPVWGYIAVAVAAFLIWKKLSGSSSSSGTASTAGAGATSSTPSTETVTTPYGSYTGPSQGGIPSSILGPAPTPGSTGSPTPGSGGGSTPPSSGTAPTQSTGSPYTQVGTATQAQQDLNSGIPIYYEPGGAGAPGAGSAPAQITQSTPGGEWSVGGQPLPPGAGGTIYTKAA
jgi:hypothetical protein